MIQYPNSKLCCFKCYLSFQTAFRNKYSCMSISDFCRRKEIGQHCSISILGLHSKQHLATVCCQYNFIFLPVLLLNKGKVYKLHVFLILHYKTLTPPNSIKSKLFCLNHRRKKKCKNTLQGFFFNFLNVSKCSINHLPQTLECPRSHSETDFLTEQKDANLYCPKSLKRHQKQTHKRDCSSSRLPPHQLLVLLPSGLRQPSSLGVFMDKS